MARRGVIVRRLAAVEGLGSCTLIGSDKTGTLTCNELTARSLMLPNGQALEVTGEGFIPDGKVLLSGLDADALEELLDTLPAYTDMTITKKGQLRKEVARTREQGYAVAVDELEVGLTAVAAPIRNAHGDVIASMSVSGPTFRLEEESVRRATARLVDAVAEVSHRLGWGQR